MLQLAKQERKSNDIITKIAPKPHVPSGTKAMDEFKYEKKVEWMGATYTIRIHRFADKSLSTVSDEDGRKYYDNKFQYRYYARMVHHSTTVRLQKTISESLPTISTLRMEPW